MIETDLDCFLRTNLGSFSFLPRPSDTAPRLPIESFKRERTSFEQSELHFPIAFPPLRWTQSPPLLPCPWACCHAVRPAPCPHPLPGSGTESQPDPQHGNKLVSDGKGFDSDAEFLNFPSVTQPKLWHSPWVPEGDKMIWGYSRKGGLFTTKQDFGYIPLSSWWADLTRTGWVPPASLLSLSFWASDPDAVPSYHCEGEEGHGKVNPWKVLLGVPSWGLLPCEEQLRAGLPASATLRPLPGGEATYKGTEGPEAEWFLASELPFFSSAF